MKRFFSEVCVAAGDGGFAVTLDERPIKTPAGLALLLPSKPLADLVAQEWRACGETIKPSDLPHTQLSNTAIDRTASDPGNVVDAICAYVETDLTCYRASRPESLKDMQSRHWDPPLAWVAEHLGLHLTTTTALMGHSQPEGSALMMPSLIADLDAFALTALHEMTTLTGSVVLTLNFAHAALSAQQAWQAATVDEHYQSKRWGEDAEAADALSKKQEQFLAAAAFWTSLKATV